MTVWEKIEVLTKALQFYADSGRYLDERHYDGKVWVIRKPLVLHDEGKRAMSALSEVGIEIGNAKCQSGAV